MADTFPEFENELTPEIRDAMGSEEESQSKLYEQFVERYFETGEATIPQE